MLGIRRNVIPGLIMSGLSAARHPARPSHAGIRRKMSCMGLGKPGVDYNAHFMDEAFKLAEEALANREVPVGCVLVCNNNLSVVARGRNHTNASYNPTLHAEIVALRQLHSERDSLPSLHDHTLYVTVEPCILCASALAKAGVGRVVYGCPNPKFGGCGTVLPVVGAGKDDTCLASASGWLPFECVSGVQADRAVALLQAFYARKNERGKG